MGILEGSRLGPYEILTLIGAGGMGEVYKARDPRLNRFVAIKLLPPDMASDHDRRARFAREAQAIAALNHPNIVTIFAVEEAGDTIFLAMELIEGHTLASDIPKHGIPLDRLLKIAIAVANAIGAAHRKGITHRDLKPANVLIGAGEHAGRVKVLDFGLAKLVSVDPAEPTATALPPGLDTGEGRVVGTVAYMSPEQAEGKAVDARSDLFALGVILYEMATGRRPFVGDSAISILSAIIRDTPTPVVDVNPSLPTELGRIVRRALAKDPERRYQSAKDLENDLEDLQAALNSGELVRTGGSQARAGAVHRWKAIAALTTCVAVALAIWLGTRSATPADRPPSATAFQMLPLTISGNARLPAISRDGKYVAYVQIENDEHGVWVRQIASNSDLRIVAPIAGQAVLGLSVTPDGGFVDYVTRRGNQAPELWRVALLGGAPRRLIEEVAVASAPGWSPDGKRMAILASDVPSGTDSVLVADGDGSNRRVLSTRKLPRMYLTLAKVMPPDFRPVWLPNGASIAVLGRDQAGDLEHVTLSLRGGQESIVPIPESRDWFPGMGMALAADGRSFVLTHLVAAGSPQLVSLRPPSSAVTRLTNDLHAYAGVSAEGDTVATAQSGIRSGLWIADASGAGPRLVGREVPTELGRWGLAWAGDSHLLYDASLIGGRGFWSMDASDGTSQFVIDNAAVPSTTADGQTLVFSRPTSEQGGWAVWRSDANGGHARSIPNANGFCPVVTPDGLSVLYLSLQSGLQSAWIQDLGGGQPRLVAPIWVHACGIAVSPDNTRAVLQSRTTDGLPEAVIVPLTGGGPVHRVAIPGGAIQWTPDGRSLAFLHRDAPSNIYIQALDGSPARQLTHLSDQRIISYGWSRDGRRLGIARGLDRSDIVLLRGVR